MPKTRWQENVWIICRKKDNRPMWTQEMLEAAARRWAFENADAPSPYINKMRAFLAGCKFVINNTQKE